jgi:hypothetical protein
MRKRQRQNMNLLSWHRTPGKVKRRGLKAVQTNLVKALAKSGRLEKELVKK